MPGQYEAAASSGEVPERIVDDGQQLWITGQPVGADG
jgi:hypothetical protein